MYIQLVQSDPTIIHRNNNKKNISKYLLEKAHANHTFVHQFS